MRTYVVWAPDFSGVIHPLTGQVIPLGAGGTPPGETISVPSDYENGAVVAISQPGYAIVGTGLAIHPSGEVYISDRAAFFAGLPKTYQITSGGNNVAALRFTSGQSYRSLDYSANAVMWFDAVDNRSITLSGDAVEEFRDKVDAARKARNDPYPAARPTLVTNSKNGNDRPALRFNPATSSSVHGLFFPDSPSYAGLQRLSFLNATTMGTRWDNTYSNNLATQPTASFPDIDLGSFVATGKPIVLSAVFTDAGSVVFRINGTQIDSETGWGSLLGYNGAAFVVFNADNAGYSNASQIFSSIALGNGYTWKQGGFRGDLYEILSLVGVTE